MRLYNKITDKITLSDGKEEEITTIEKYFLDESKTKVFIRCQKKEDLIYLQNEYLDLKTKFKNEYLINAYYVKLYSKKGFTGGITYYKITTTKIKKISKKEFNKKIKLEDIFVHWYIGSNNQTLRERLNGAYKTISELSFNPKDYVFYVSDEFMKEIIELVEIKIKYEGVKIKIKNNEERIDYTDIEVKRKNKLY